MQSFSISREDTVPTAAALYSGLCEPWWPPIWI